MAHRSPGQHAKAPATKSQGPQAIGGFQGGRPPQASTAKAP
jgi:hypothetical protein